MNRPAKRTSLWFLPLALLGLVAGAAMMLFGLRNNVEIVTGKSLPALRLAFELGDTAAEIQILLLKSATRTEANSSGGETAAVRELLAHSSDLLDEYAKTILQERDRRNYQHAVESLNQFRQEVLRYLDRKSGIESLSASFRDYDQALDTLRNYRHFRAGERLASSLQTGERIFWVQLTLLCAALGGIGLIALYLLIRNLHEPNPDNF